MKINDLKQEKKLGRPRHYTKSPEERMRLNTPDAAAWRIERLNELLHRVAAASGIAVADLLGSSRKAPLPDVRAFFCAKAYEQHHRCCEISRVIGMKHPSVVCAVYRFRMRISIGDTYCCKLLEKYIE
jgi:hypothetical protein